MADSDRAGVVLAGGFSTRFGDRDKALAAVDGTPMLARVVDRLTAAVNAVVVSCRDEQRDAFAATLDREVRFALDPEPDGGPLVGVETALEGIDAEYTAVVACDMPALDSAFVSHLFERAAGREGAVPELRDGHRQPAQAVYRTDAMLAAAHRQLDADRRSLRAAVDGLDVAVLPPDEVEEHTSWRSLENVNTREKLDSFERT